MEDSFLRLFSLRGKTALVTGASRGLGQAITIGLAAAGADVVCVANGDPSETKAMVEKMARRCWVLHTDLTIPGEAVRVAEEALSVAGPIDILVNNAGIIRRAPAEAYSDKDWQDVFEVNLNAVYHLSQTLGRNMLEMGRGRIINVCSMLSFQGGKNVVAYTASKHALAGLTRSMSNEWSARGVRVNALAPGYMATDNTAPLRADGNRSAEILSRIPMGRWGTAEDLVGAAVFLASDASNYVTGHVLCVDGGWMGT